MSVMVVLHEPQDIVNIAAVVRLMKNFGLRDLRLVNPAEYDTHRIEGIAHKTGEVLRRVAVFDRLDAALADCTHVVGLTARGRAAKRTVQSPRDAAHEILDAAGSGIVCLLLGREDKGLSNTALDRCHRMVTIPTNPEHPSMNLGHAFGLIAYELFLARGHTPPSKQPRKAAPPVRHESLELLFADARAALEAIEFFKTGNPDIVMRTVRDLVHRTPLDERETKLVRAMCLEVVRFLERAGVRP